MGKFVLDYQHVRKEDIVLVGEKAASIGEMKHAGFPIPAGFIVTSAAYFYFLKENNLITQVNHLLRTANFSRADEVTQVAENSKRLIQNAKMPEQLANEIFHSYTKIVGTMKSTAVDLYSSVVGEDAIDSKITGNLGTYLRVEGESNVILKIKSAWASLFSAHALSQRHQRRVDHFRLGVAVAIQKSVNAEKSGIIYTVDPQSDDKKMLIIEACFGQNHKDAVSDRYVVDKTNNQILEKKVEMQEKQTYFEKGKLKESRVNKKLSNRQKLSDEQIEMLAMLGKKLEKQFFFPQKIVWEMENEKIYIQYSHPLTPIIVSEKIRIENKPSSLDKKLITKGKGIHPGIATGVVRIITNDKDLSKIKAGDIIVANSLRHFFPKLKKAAGIVIDKNESFPTAKNNFPPTVSGTVNATALLRNNQIVSVNGTKGEIYKGGVLQVAVGETSQKISTATKLFISLGDFTTIENQAKVFSDGAVISSGTIIKSIGIHPKKIINDEKNEWYCEQIASQVEKICTAFSPRAVIFTLADLYSSDLRQMTGGKDYEPAESNPKMGYSGAFRAISDPSVFEQELNVVKVVRHKKKQKNIHILLPTARNVLELEEIKKTITAFGLPRSSSFQLWMPVAVPVNVILLDHFIEVGIDGVAIKADILSQLLLGIDRDNSEVSRAYKPQNEGVLWAYEHVIKTCHRYKIPVVFLTDSAPPALLLEKLISWGVSSITIPPLESDMVRKTIYNIEKKL